MIEEKDMTDSEIILVKNLKKICNEFDFIFGVSLMCKGPDASTAMLQYLNRHPEAASSDIIDYASRLCDKYNPDLIVE
ncbi:hypothetical protein [Holdemania massiliensis]|uniref:hypothetical protein n=1 Tax=Holdemania massiliensis TaxID=1468449 RepID=UPI001F06A424|nr:hypothetical protein [Holdemania massiliensis]MCH1940029.1 hypothetical protein [Holdemania massiliensis]